MIFISYIPTRALGTGVYNRWVLEHGEDYKVELNGKYLNSKNKMVFIVKAKKPYKKVLLKNNKSSALNKLKSYKMTGEIKELCYSQNINL